MIDHYTLRDAAFYSMCLSIYHNSLRNKSEPIHVEFGYGGARLLDCRWLGPLTFDTLCDSIHNCMIRHRKISFVGASAGNIIAATLAILLQCRFKCCGLDSSEKRRRFRIDKSMFEHYTDLILPDYDTCVCSAARRIFDFLFELCVLQEHPVYRDNSKVNNLETLSKIFSGTETVENFLFELSPDSMSAATFSQMYVHETVQYLAVLYRVLNNLQGILNLAYMLCRQLIMNCIVLYPNEEEEALGNLEDFLSIQYGSKSLKNDSFVFTEIIHHQLLARIMVEPSLMTLDLINTDAEGMNILVDGLASSVDIRRIIMPYILNFFVKWKQKRLKLRTNVQIGIIRTWRWDGRVPTFEYFNSFYMERILMHQKNMDILTNTTGKLPNFEDVKQSNAR